MLSKCITISASYLILLHGTRLSKGVWLQVKHKHGGSVVELFHMTALIPEQYLERLPPTLFASELANRSNVQLRKQAYVMRCKVSPSPDSNATLSPPSSNGV